MDNAKSNNWSLFMKAFLLILFVFTFAFAVKNNIAQENQTVIKTELATVQQSQKNAVLAFSPQLPLFNIKWTFGYEAFLLSKQNLIKETYSHKNLSHKLKILSNTFLGFKEKLDSQCYIIAYSRIGEIVPSHLV